MRQTDSSSNRLLSFATSWLLCARWIAETNPKDVGDIPFVSGILSPSRTFLQPHHLIISPPFSVIPLMQRVTRETRDSRETRGVVCLPALFASRSGISARKPPAVQPRWRIRSSQSPSSASSGSDVSHPGGGGRRSRRPLQAARSTDGLDRGPLGGKINPSDTSWRERRLQAKEAGLSGKNQKLRWWWVVLGG